MHLSVQIGALGGRIADMVARATNTEVLSTSEARALLTSITAQFREHGAACGPVLFGSHQVPEAALVPYELVELLDPIIEDLVIAARVRERRAADDGVRYSIDEAAAELGITLG